MNKQRPYQGYLVNSLNEARPVAEKHRREYYQIEQAIYNWPQSFTEFDLERVVAFDRKTIRSCLHRLEHLNTIKKTGEYKKTGARGRPARIWSR